MIKVITDIVVSDAVSSARSAVRTVASASGNPKVLEFAFASNDTKTIFNPTNSSSPDYGLTPSMIILVASAPLDVEFTVNEGDAQENVFTLRLAASIPLVLGSLLSYDTGDISGGVTTFSTPTELIEKIRVDNPTTDAKTLTFIYQ